MPRVNQIIQNGGGQLIHNDQLYLNQNCADKLDVFQLILMTL